MKVLGKIDLSTGKILEGGEDIRKQPKVIIAYETPDVTCACQQGNNCGDKILPVRVEKKLQ